MEQLKNIVEKIDELSLRERAIVFIGLIMVIIFLWDIFLLSPLELEQKKIVSSLSKKNADRMVLLTQYQNSIKQNQIDPDAENMERLKELRFKVINVQAELESSTENLVTPRDMPKLLETVLHKTGGLTLVNLRSTGVTPLIEKEEIKNEEKSTGNETKLTAENIDNAYRHGLRIELIGDYLTILKYLKSLETLEWGFYWDNFELNVNEYPEATTSIEVFTLSLQEAWIGV
jgi:MSHA biogenesis protein MshJ